MTPLRAGIYARISKDRTGLALGVDRQVEDCRDLATVRGWDVVGTYIDNDVSASTKSKAPRPEYQRLLKDAESGVIDAIIVYNMDRLTRRVFETAQFLQWREERSVKFVTTEGDDTETSSGRMIINIKAAVAQQEAERISERVGRSLSQRLDMGRASAGGHGAFGWSDSQYQVIDRRQAKAVRDGAKMILDGATVGDVMRDWAGRDIGAPTSRTAVRRILTNPRTAGFLTDKGVEIGSGQIKPLLDEATFRAVQGVLKAHTRGGHQVRTQVLAGLVVCGLCETKMAAQVTASRARWACSTSRGGCGKVSRDYNWLGGYVDRVVREALQSVPGASEEVPGAPEVAEIARLEDLLAKTRQMVLSGDLGDDGLGLMSDIRQQIAALRDSQTLSSPALPPVDLLQVWASPDPATLGARKRIVDTLVARIIVLPLEGGGYGAVRPLPYESVRIVMRS